MKVYLGFDWSSRRRKMNNYPYCFLSVAVPYSYTQYKSLPAWTINNAKDVMLDSGGFSLLNRFGDYPFDIPTFVRWVHDMNNQNFEKVTFVATPDYPCEKEITRKINLKTNRERIIHTVDKAVECWYEYEDINWMPVLQGYTVDEYKHCLRLYRSRGINPEKFAIGSMCRRKNIKEMENIVKELIDYGLNEKIHLFGLNLQALKSDFLINNIDSCDSITYGYGCSTQKETFDKMNKTIENIYKYGGEK